MGKIIRSKERTIIMKVIQFFEMEKVNRKFTIPVNEVMERTRAATGASKRDMDEILAGDYEDDASYELIKNVLKFFEAESSRMTYAIDQVIKRAKAATGASKRTIIRIKSEAKNFKESLKDSEAASKLVLPTPGLNRRLGLRKKRIEMSEQDITALGNIINRLYNEKGKMPSLPTIFAAAQTELNFPGQRTTLRNIMDQRLGILYKKKARPPKQDNNIERKEICDTEPTLIDEMEESDDYPSDNSMDESFVNVNPLVTNLLTVVTEERKTEVEDFNGDRDNLQNRNQVTQSHSSSSEADVKT